jgi:NADH-quinone oxidoreductase subunit J
MTAPILFFVFAIVALAAALGMLLSKNPVSSALWLILNLFCVAGLFLTLNAEFIAVIQILVYAGAIMVLFVFVIMLLNLSDLPDLKKVEWRRIVAFTMGMGLLSMLTFISANALNLAPNPPSLAIAAENGSVSNLAKVMFTQYAMPLEVIGILLLAATIGAVVIAKRKPV